MSVHTRFRALGLATLAAITALSVVSASTGDGLIAQTEAAYTDSEFAKAGVAAKWPLAFSSLVAGSAKSSNETVNASSNMTYQSVYRWTEELTGESFRPIAETTTGRPNYSREWDERYRGPGLAVNDLGAANPLGNTDPYANALHNWDAVPTFANPGLSNPRQEPQNRRCLVINESFAPAANDPRCRLGNGLAAVTNTTEAFGFSINVNSAYNAFLNAANLSTGVQCSPDSAVAEAPTGRVDLGTEQGGINPYLSYLTFGSAARTIWANGQLGLGNSFTDRTLSPIWTIGEVPIVPERTRAKVMPVITQHSQESPPYAISEIAAYVEVYGRQTYVIGGETLRAKMYFVLSRSECGVKRLTDSTLPSKRPVFPATLPGGNGLTPYSGTGFTVASAPAPVQRMALQDSPETTTTTSLPPTITLTSPLESATAAVTTTSAPPDPSGSDPTESSGTSTATSTKRESTTTTNDTTTVQTATTTSASPAIAIPDDPGTLSASAQTAKVGTVEVDGEELVVVVKGDTVPADARTALTALGTWINEGARPSGDWRTFTSSEPDSDGWRWAAVNQVTGTIVYIR